MELNTKRKLFKLTSIFTAIMILIVSVFAVVYSTYGADTVSFVRTKGDSPVIYTHVMTKDNTVVNGKTLTTYINNSYPRNFTINAAEAVTVESDGIHMQPNSFFTTKSTDPFNGLKSFSSNYTGGTDMRIASSTASPSSGDLSGTYQKVTSGTKLDITANGANFIRIRNYSANEIVASNITLYYECSAVTPATPTSVTLKIAGNSANSQTFHMGTAVPLELTTAFTCANNSHKDVKYYISNPSVLELEQTSSDWNKGRITRLLGNGTCVVTAKWHDLDEYSDSITVTVDTLAESITLNKTNFTIDRANATSTTLIGTISPNSTTNKTIYWSTGDASIATVSASSTSGNPVTVTAVGNGTTTITGTSADGNATVSTNVTVKSTATTISLSDTSNPVVLYINGTNTKTITATIACGSYPLSDNKVNWTSNDTSKVTVSNAQVSSGTGVTLTAVAKGSATITVASNDGGVNETINVRVDVLSSSLTATTSALTIDRTVNPTYQLDAATIVPSNVSNNKVNWTSSDTSVATITAQTTSGNKPTLTLLSSGSTTVSARPADNNVAAKSRTITVWTSVNSISVTAAGGVTNLDVSNQQYSNTRQLSASILPADADNKTVTWSSSNTSIATVSSSGLVTAVAKGSVTITATAADNRHVTGTINLTVNTTVTGISLSPSSAFNLDLNSGTSVATSKTITATVAPTTSSQRTVTWTISPTGYATFNDGTTSKSTTLNGSGQASVTVVPVAATTTDITITASITDGAGTNSASVKIDNIYRGENTTKTGTWPTPAADHTYTSIDGTLVSPGTVHQNFSDGTSGNFYQSISTSTGFALISQTDNNTIAGNALKINNLKGGDNQIVKISCDAIPRDVPVKIDVSFKLKWLGTTNIDRNYFGLRYDGSPDLYNIQLNTVGTATNTVYDVSYSYTMTIPGIHPSASSTGRGPNFFLAFLGQSDSHTSSPFVVDSFDISYSYASVPNTTANATYGLPCTNRGSSNGQFRVKNNVNIADWSAYPTYSYVVTTTNNTAFDVTFTNSTGYIVSGHKYQVIIKYWANMSGSHDLYAVISLGGSVDIVKMCTGASSGTWTSGNYTASSNSINVRFHSPSGWSQGLPSADGSLFIQSVTLKVIS